MVLKGSSAKAGTENALDMPLLSLGQAPSTLLQSGSVRKAALGLVDPRISRETVLYLGYYQNERIQLPSASFKPLVEWKEARTQPETKSLLFKLSKIKSA